MKLWHKGRTRLDPRVEAFTVGCDPELDQGLIPYDCRASIAHARMLQAVGILKEAVARALIKELERIFVLWRSGRFRVRPSDEDGHTAIENHLVRKLGRMLARMLVSMLASKHTSMHRDKLLALLRAKLGKKLATKLDS